MRLIEIINELERDRLLKILRKESLISINSRYYPSSNRLYITLFDFNIAVVSPNQWQESMGWDTFNKYVFNVIDNFIRQNGTAPEMIHLFVSIRDGGQKVTNYRINNKVVELLNLLTNLKIHIINGYSI